MCTLEEMRLNVGSERRMALLKVDIGQIDVSGRKNVSRLLYSKHVFKSFIHFRLIHSGQPF